MEYNANRDGVHHKAAEFDLMMRPFGEVEFMRQFECSEACAPLGRNNVVLRSGLQLLREATGA